MLLVCSPEAVLAAESCKSPCRTRVMSINLANVRDVRQITAEIKINTGSIPDILLLQEVAKQKGSQTSVAEDVARLLGLQAAFAAPKPGPTSIGVAILSRWPITDIKVHTVPRFYRILKIRPRIALGITTQAPSGPIRIWTTHLDTRINVEERLKQLRPIIHAADGYQGPCIIGGDLNTLALGWLLHAVPYPTGNAHARAVADLMSRHGFKTPFKHPRPTFDRFGLQLDWVYLRGLKATASGIAPLAFSDHHAVWTEFALGDTPAESQSLISTDNPAAVKH